LFVASKSFMIRLQKLCSQKQEFIKNELVRTIHEYDSIHSDQPRVSIETHPKVFVRVVQEIMMKLKLKLMVNDNSNDFPDIDSLIFETFSSYLDTALKNPGNVELNVRDNLELYFVMSVLIIKNKNTLKNVTFLDTLLSRFSDNPEVYPYLNAYCGFMISKLEKMRDIEQSHEGLAEFIEQKINVYKKMKR